MSKKKLTKAQEKKRQPLTKAPTCITAVGEREKINFKFFSLQFF